jgi:rod shape-determining protein MreD
LQDFIFYGHMLGANSFAMGLTGYMAGLLQDRRQHFVLGTVSLVGLAYIVFESMLYGSYRLFNVTKIDFGYALTRYTLPSALFNMLVALIFYIPMRKLLDYLTTAKKGGQTD